jgi:hypothetical protein
MTPWVGNLISSSQSKAFPTPIKIVRTTDYYLHEGEKKLKNKKRIRGKGLKGIKL